MDSDLAHVIFGDSTETGEFSRDDYDKGGPIDFYQAKKFYERGEQDDIYFIEPHSFRSRDTTLIEELEPVREEWDRVQIYFAGGLYETEQYLFTAYIVYEDVEHPQEFKEWLELRFCSTVGDGEMITEDHPKVTTSNLDFRYVEDDPLLKAEVDEFQWRDGPPWGKFCRIWWDD